MPAGSQLFDFGNAGPVRGPRSQPGRVDPHEDDELEDESENLMGHASAWDKLAARPSSQGSSVSASGRGGSKKRAFDWGDDDLEDDEDGGRGKGRAERRGITNPLEKQQPSQALSNPLDRRVSSSSRTGEFLPIREEDEGEEEEDVGAQGHRNKSTQDRGDSMRRSDSGMPMGQVRRSAGSQDSDILLAQSLQPQQSLESLGHMIDDEDAAPAGGRPPIPGPAGLSSHNADALHAGGGRGFNNRRNAAPRQPGLSQPPVELPLRRPRAPVRAHDPDFDSESWKKMIRDFDQLPAPGADEAQGGGRVSTSVSSVLSSKQKTKVPMLRVFVKVITFNDDSADAILKDPTAEIQACIHGSLLEEEGDALACGATLVLRKVTVFHAFNGRDRSLIVTPNNLVRCYPAAKAPRR